MSLHHVGLDAVDVDAEVAFWGLLGFVEVEPPEALRGTWRWVGRGETQIHLRAAERPALAGHVAVVVPAFAEVCARLAAVGRIPELGTAHWGAPRAKVRSPAGHIVELMATPPA